MALQIGLVGLPNVGKSTTFKAITKKQVDVQNYPFCTIDPNVGVVAVPDPRLTRLAEISTSQKIIPTSIEFVDIAGLVRGASKGEGLGNKFLANIREVDAIAMVVRDFQDDKIIHVHNQINPQEDIEIIQLELILADLESIEKRIDGLEKKAKSNDKEAKVLLEIALKYKTVLSNNQLANTADLHDEEKQFQKHFQLLTNKPFVYIRNVDEEEAIRCSQNTDSDQFSTGKVDAPVVSICAKLEAELSELPQEEVDMYLTELGVKYTGLDRMIRACYQTLGLISYLTTGPQETRAWTIKKGTLGPQAAAVIHTDFEKTYIRAEVIKFQDLDTLGSEQACKAAGKVAMQGKDYEVQDGDVIHFFCGA